MNLFRKVLLEVADPSRGLFGDGNVYKRTKCKLIK
jgi:hypothetical protein